MSSSCGSHRQGHPASGLECLTGAAQRASLRLLGSPRRQATQPPSLSSSSFRCVERKRRRRPASRWARTCQKWGPLCPGVRAGNALLPILTTKRLCAPSINNGLAEPVRFRIDGYDPPKTPFNAVGQGGSVFEARSLGRGGDVQASDPLLHAGNRGWRKTQRTEPHRQQLRNHFFSPRQLAAEREW